MAQRRLSMRKIKEILRLKYEAKLTKADGRRVGPTSCSWWVQCGVLAV